MFWVTCEHVFGLFSLESTKFNSNLECRVGRGGNDGRAVTAFTSPNFSGTSHSSGTEHLGSVETRDPEGSELSRECVFTGPRRRRWIYSLERVDTSGLGR